MYILFGLCIICNETTDYVMVLISKMDKVKYFKMLKYQFLDILEEKNKYYKNRDLLKKKKKKKNLPRERIFFKNMIVLRLSF